MLTESEGRGPDPSQEQLDAAGASTSAGVSVTETFTPVCPCCGATKNIHDESGGADFWCEGCGHEWEQPTAPRVPLDARAAEPEEPPKPDPIVAIVTGVEVRKSDLEADEAGTLKIEACAVVRKHLDPARADGFRGTANHRAWIYLTTKQHKRWAQGQRVTLRDYDRAVTSAMGVAVK